MSLIPTLGSSANSKLLLAQSFRIKVQQFAQHSLPVLGLGIVLGLIGYAPEFWRFLLALLALSIVPSLLQRSNHPLGIAFLLAPLMLFTYVPALTMMRMQQPWLLSIYPVVLLSTTAYLSTFFLFVICRLPRTQCSWGLAAIISSILAGLPILGAYQNVSTLGMLLPGPWLVFLGPYSGLALVLLMAACTDFKVWRSRWIYLCFTIVLILSRIFTPEITSFTRQVLQLHKPPIPVLVLSTGYSREMAERRVNQWDARDQTLSRFVHRQNNQTPAKLIVLPELARYALGFEGLGFQKSIGLPNSALYGAIERGVLGYYNAVYQGDNPQPIYRKHTLVPLAETKWLLPGVFPVAIQINALKIGILLCLEGMFRLDTNALARQGAEILVVPSDNTGYWPYAFQSLAIKIAAYSSGLPVIISNESGGSLIQSVDGEIIAQGNWNEPNALFGRIEAGSPTLYARWGDWPWLLLILLAVWYLKTADLRQNRSAT